ncbi:MAG: carboxy terminal-processing peptidase [Alphaproteobacteria bacterium]|nr:carboxy terminal-processing peptidase [Alphaproteobacteria bacterium]
MSAVARRVVLPLGVAFAVATPFALADALAPDTVQPAIAHTVAMILDYQHYDRQKAIDDALSKAWLDGYLDQLDYGRLYFLASDVQEFRTRFATVLDDDVLAPQPSLDAAFAIHTRFLERLGQRMDHIDKVLAANAFDFSDPARTVDVDRHEDPWATTPAELDAIWRDRIAAEVLGMLLNGEERAKAIERLQVRYKRIRTDLTSLESVDVLELYLVGLTESFDPHSRWLKPVSKESFDIDLQDSLTGIGAVLTIEDGYTTIRELVAGGPADGTGELAPGDRILAVTQGDDGDPVDVVEMRLDNVVQLIRGPADTVVRLTIHPKEAADPAERREVRIVRDKVKLDRAAAKGAIHAWDDVQVGVLDVPSFYVDAAARRAGDPEWASTARDMRRILGQFQQQGVDVVVVDLRRNGGGALDQAIEVSGLFIDTGPVVQTRDNGGRIDVFDDREAGVAWDGPLVVLTSEGSASASEIFAGAMQDYGRGLVVGAKATHGKGTVQNLQNLGRSLRRAGVKADPGDGGALKFTSHMFFRVDGRSTQVMGVEADIVLPSPLEGLDIREADLDNPLPFSSIPPATYAPLGLGVDVGRLRTASAARVAADPEFGFLREAIVERSRQRELGTISLHEATRRAELDRMKDRAEARKAARADATSDVPPARPLDGKAPPPEPTPPAPQDGEEVETEGPDAILDEALRIARDMVLQGRS